MLLHNKSLSDLQKLAKLRRIKNIDNLSKEDLIYTLFRTKENIFENNYTKYTNNDTNDPIKAKINKIRITAAKLGHILTKEERNFIREKLYKLENKKRFTKSEKQRALAYLIELANTLDKKEKYQHSDHDDQDYFGIRDIENLFTTIDDIDYYKPILTRESFNGKCQYYELRGDRYKNLSLKQYISTITPEIAELIRNKSTNQNEQKMQLTMNINFMHTTDPNKNRNFYVKSDNVEIRPGSNINDVLIKLLESFLDNYGKEEQILRNGSNYSFESVDMTAIHFHDIELKRGSSYIAVKSISRLFRGITSDNNGDFYCLNCLHSLRTDNTLKKHERLCDNHDYCNIVMPSKDKYILKYNSGQKSLNVANVIYFDLESLSIKNHSSQNNLEQSYTEKKSTHEAADIQ